LDAIVTLPLEELRVTGKSAPVLVVGLAVADVVAVPGLDVLGFDVAIEPKLELDEEQAASAATAKVAVTTATVRRVRVFIGGYFLPVGGKEGETAGAPRASPLAKTAGTDRPSHEGRCRPARQKATWLGPRARGRHSCGTAPEWPTTWTSPASLPARRQPAGG